MEKLYLLDSVVKLRTSKGWSQKDFVSLLSMRLQDGVEYATYGMWERGKRAVSATVALEVAKLLGVNIKEIAELK